MRITCCTLGASRPVHVTGTADEFELAWTAFVQNEACPATLVEAQNQPDATKHLPARTSPGAIVLPLDKKTVALVRKIRKKHKGGPVKVTVDATATPPSGAPLQATRVVKVS
jgi:hypothetical protein